MIINRVTSAGQIAFQTLIWNVTLSFARQFIGRNIATNGRNIATKANNKVKK